MRGVAALLAAGATWVAVSGATPSIDLRGRIPDPAVIGGSIVSACLAGVGVLVVTGIPALAIAVGCLAALVPGARAARRASRARWERIRQWPDILAHVRNGLGSGSSITDTLIESFERAGGPFEVMAEDVRREAAFGGGLGAAVTAIRSSGVDPTTERVLVTLATASETGGRRVGQIVGTLSRSVADDIRLREAHDAALTEQRMTVGVALVAPWVMLMLAVVTNPQAGSAFARPSGAIVIGIGTAATVVGWTLARRAARLSEPPDVFR